jgi:hypothetical protein
VLTRRQAEKQLILEYRRTGSRRDRDRLAARLAELRGLDALVRERVSVVPPPPPVPLHRMAAERAEGKRP